MPDILNFSAYRFVALDALPTLRERLLSTGDALGLKGTVLLADEGINLFVAGLQDAVDAWCDALAGADARLAGLQGRRSWSEAVPFRHLRVKVKREIIRMNQPAVQPQTGRAPGVAPRDLRRWLDQGHDDAGRPLRLLDTRNAFEVDAGAFTGALDWRLGKFSDFPAALDARRAELEGHTVVGYCTGGIRCEKAVLAMRALGIEALQLDGGILQYLEDTGGAHWSGHCVVFDQRERLDATLAPA